MTAFLKTLCVAALSCAASAHAGTITFVDSSAVPNVAKFDPALGTLQSVFFRNTYNNAIYLSYTGDPSAAAPVINVVGTIGDAIFGQVSINQQVQTQFAGDPRIIGFQLSNQVEATFTGDLSAYIGRGNLTVAPYAFLTTGFSAAGVSFPSPFSRASVTYTFIDAVPEPATWALMLTGFAMTGYALRRRRARVVFA